MSANIINTTITQATQSANKIDFGKIMAKVIFFSNLVVKRLVAWLGTMGWSFSETQISILLAVILLLILYIVIKFGEKLKFWVKWLIIGLVVWLILGFFVPVS